ncbi:MAG: right-handed parallel beta-helix repeat-containing protein [Verrucomicrobiae bacterium]|nr:right-handed parallel beta-helix repeat-containing protein [Verrucomicrobiae bacterium]
MIQKRFKKLASYGVLMLLFSGCSRSWHVNDASTEGDVFTKAVGDKEKGNGSVNKPFLTIEQAVQKASPGDTIFIDTGVYTNPVDQAVSVVVSVDKPKLSVEGAGVEKTRIQLPTNPKEFQCGIRIAAEKVRLQNLSIKGGTLGVFIHQTSQAVVKNVNAEGQTAHGFLLDQAQKCELSDCQAQKIGFRGFQLKDATDNKIHHNLSKENGNAGFCLSSSAGNSLQQNIAQDNATSGFFINGSSQSNLIANNRAISNGIGGFYLYGKSRENQLKNNFSQGNGVGISLNNSYANTLSENQICSNKGYGVVCKSGSDSNKILGNRLSKNKAPQICIAKENEKNNRVENNVVEN